MLFTVSTSDFAGLLTSVFQNSAQLQGQLLEEILTKVLPSLPMGKRCRRAYVVGDSSSAAIQVITAMLIQMTQVRCSNHLDFHAHARRHHDLPSCSACCVVIKSTMVVVMALDRRLFSWYCSNDVYGQHIIKEWG